MNISVRWLHALLVLCVSLVAACGQGDVAEDPVRKPLGATTAAPSYDKDDLYRFFAIAFGAAPGVTYIGQLLEAANAGMSIKAIVNVFTTKPQFLETYPASLTNQEYAQQLVDNVVGTSATAAAKAEAVADIVAALSLPSWTRGDITYAIFDNLAKKPVNDLKWAGTAKKMANQVAYAKYFTEIMKVDVTEIATLRSVVKNVNESTVSTGDLRSAILIATGAQTGELYVSPTGGKLAVNFTPEVLPTWIKREADGYRADPVQGCSNRVAPLKAGTNDLKVIQTSPTQCNEPELTDANYWYLMENNNYWWKEQSGLLYTSPEDNWPRKRGTGQFKFEVKYGDCGGTDCTRLDGSRDRSEIGVNLDLSKPPGISKPELDKEIWYSFSFYVPSPYLEQGNQVGTSQTVSFHQIMNTFETNGVREWYPMVMLAKQFNGPMVARTYPTAGPYEEHILIQDKDFEGRWHDIMVRYKPSTTNGILQIWINNILKVDYTKRTIVNASTEIYMKFGVYRPAVPTNPVQNVYFDELRYGRSKESVEPR